MFIEKNSWGYYLEPEEDDTDDYYLLLFLSKENKFIENVSSYNITTSMLISVKVYNEYVKGKITENKFPEKEDEE